MRTSNRCRLLAVMMTVALPWVATDFSPESAALGQENAASKTYPPGEKVFGKSYADWSAAWWRWAVAIPKDKSPVRDMTGAFASQGQGGQVWFLAGTLDGSAERKVTVPAGKALFFPIITTLGALPASKKAPVGMLSDYVKIKMDELRPLEVTLDGKSLAEGKGYRVESDEFSLTGPEKEADAAFPGMVGELRAVSGGYWVMLQPLPPGEHTLRFRGKAEHKIGPFAVDVTYRLSVTAEKK
ncbi:MAG TPA: hypothetical protein VEL76_25110 [Gemmataceae bacterium]|nr:hypothetical protein [Gemmataceae bacterium]